MLEKYVNLPHICFLIFVNLQAQAEKAAAPSLAGVTCRNQKCVVICLFSFIQLRSVFYYQEYYEVYSHFYLQFFIYFKPVLSLIIFFIKMMGPNKSISKRPDKVYCIDMIR